MEVLLVVIEARFGRDCRGSKLVCLKVGKQVCLFSGGKVSGLIAGCWNLCGLEGFTFNCWL